MIDAPILHYHRRQATEDAIGVTSGDGLSCGRETWADLMETDIYTFSIA